MLSLILGTALLPTLVVLDPRVPLSSGGWEERPLSEDKEGEGEDASSSSSSSSSASAEAGVYKISRIRLVSSDLSKA
jgi:hypothetical protein